MNLEAFRDMVVGFLRDRRPDRAATFASLRPNDDLFETGAVDSHTFIELCLAIEDRTGVAVDIADLDPEDFSTIAALHRIAGSPIAG
jgi:acyl carrier protein